MHPIPNKTKENSLPRLNELNSNEFFEIYNIDITS